MNSAIEDIIQQKPHLAEPLRFYEKSLKFRDTVKGSIELRPDGVAYPPESLESIFESFSTAVQLPDGSLSPLKQAMHLGEIDFTRLPLGEVPAFTLPYSEDDLTVLLFLISKPFFLKLREMCRLDNRFWEEGRCPVCNSQPSLSWTGGDGRRQLFCSFCETTGTCDKIACPICSNSEGPGLNLFAFEREEGFKVRACDKCKSYVKEAAPEMISRLTPEIADLASLPLDIVVQERGYVRRSPNPLGMKKLTMSG